MTMGVKRHVAVIDIGKTNAKVALVDGDSLTEIAVRRTPNMMVAAGPYPHYDDDALWEFILASLAALNRIAPIDVISVTTHGATAALLDDAGGLALPILDYEYEGPEETKSAYDQIRPDFAETGSPRLPGGLNLGAQLFWQQRTLPDRFAHVSQILMYPQYWSFRLTGVAAMEVTSLGCHTDLWSVAQNGFSSLIDRMGWRRKMPPLRKAGDHLGPLLPDVAAGTGLSSSASVLCGIHDSNASLLRHLLAREAPFSVVSTGTWVVAMAVGGKQRAMDPDRDTLVNVSALGDPVPSARFMGGREFAILAGGTAISFGQQDIAAVLGAPMLQLPSLVPGSGPFPARIPRFVSPREPHAGERQVASSFYLAMMTATCLDLIGATGPVIVEGPFASNTLFCRMLASATGRKIIADLSTSGTIGGAAFLAIGHAPANPSASTSYSPESELQDYARAWASASGSS